LRYLKDYTLNWFDIGIFITMLIEEISEDNGLKIIKMWNGGVKDVEHDEPCQLLLYLISKMSSSHFPEFYHQSSFI
jgi:hypothetical protein